MNVQPTPLAKLAANAIYFPLVPTSHKPSLDKTFLRQLVSILRIAFPKWRSKEVLILVLHSCFLVLRTVLSVAVARLDGRIVRDLVSADGRGFLKGLGLWFLLAIPSTYTNSMVSAKFSCLRLPYLLRDPQIRHLQSTLSLRLCTKLTRYTDDLYLASYPDLRYYRVALEGGLSDVDQYITSDISAFCDALSGI